MIKRILYRLVLGIYWVLGHSVIIIKRILYWPVLGICYLLVYPITWLSELLERLEDEE